jgi:hypothetical protein
MIDMIAVSPSLVYNITDCKTTHDGIRCDHSALCLIGKMHSFKPKHSSLNKGKPNLRAIQYNNEINERFNDHIEANYDIDNNIYDE